MELQKILDIQRICSDLNQCFTQKTRTTKQDRREKVLAYILEITSFDITVFSDENTILETLKAVEELQSKAMSQEAKTSLERSSKRLRNIINNPKSFKKQCVACDEYYTGDNHVCTNKIAKGKDATMAYDDSFI